MRNIYPSDIDREKFEKIRHLNPNHIFTIGYSDGKRTLLEAACMKNSSSLIWTLKKAGVDIEKTGGGKCHILHTIATIGLSSFINVARMLVANGADVNAQDDQGNTPLHLAAANGNIEMAEYLAKKIKDINIKDNAGRTSLHLAVSNGHKGLVEKLMNMGLNPSVKNNDGKTAMYYASSEDIKNILQPKAKLEKAEIESTQQEQGKSL